jgi:hypothetical protein
VSTITAPETKKKRRAMRPKHLITGVINTSMNILELDATLVQLLGARATVTNSVFSFL